MRVFIAVELQDKILEYIHKKQQAIKLHCTRGNFTRKENLHLTLKFLGEVEQNQIAHIDEILQTTAAVFAPFSLELGELGTFPRGNRNILWIGIQNGRKELKRLVLDLETRFEKLGFEREKRPFKAHITIGREIQLKDHSKEAIKHINMEPREIRVSRISLMESKRINGILKYIPLSRIEIKEK